MGSTSSMMVRPQDSIEASNKVLLNTSEPKFKGRKKRGGGDYNDKDDASFGQKKKKGKTKKDYARVVLMWCEI